MSLNVYLTLEGETRKGTGIFIRENGRIREISKAEWDDKFPGKEPVRISDATDDNVFWYNITHNLAEMADKAGIYLCLWRPEELKITTAHQLIKPLRDGLKKLERKPDYYKKFNPSNGWGDYQGLVTFVEKYLAACQMYPEAKISVSR